MKKSVFSFIIPLAILSLAVFAVVGAPQKVGAQVAANISVEKITPAYSSVNTTFHDPHTDTDIAVILSPLIGLRANATGSDMNIASLRLSVGSSTSILINNIPRIYITDSAGKILYTLLINPSALVRQTDGTLTVNFGTNILVQQNVPKDFVVALDASSVNFLKSIAFIPVEGIRAIDFNGLTYRVPQQIIDTSPIAQIPSITVLSPNGGEAYSSSGAVPFSGATNYPSKQLEVYLYSPVNGNVATVHPSNDSNNPTSFKGTFSGDPSIGIGQYKVTACDLGVESPVTPGKPLCDSSDAYFNVVATSTPPTPCYTFSTNLQLGSRGADVVALQTFLIAKGFPIADLSASGAAQKGYFGYSTFQALKKYQTSVGIPATGYFGPMTRAKVNADCSTTPPVPIKSIVVNSPNGGEVWQQGSKHDVTWSSKDSVGKIVNIYADFANPSNILCIKSPCISSSVLIAEKVTNKGVYTWNVGNADYKGGLPNDNYYVRVCSVTDKNNCDSSDAPFSLVSPTSPSPLTITYPKMGQVLQTGFSYKIMWTTGSLDKDALFDITVFLDSGKGNIFEGLTTAQASCVGDFNIKGGPLYTCIVGWTPTEVSSKAQLAVVKRGTNEVGYSGSFSIVSTTNTQPSITVQSPNGGEFWRIGNQYTVNYSATDNIQGPLRIYIDKYHEPSSGKSGVNSTLLLGETINGKSFNYSVPGLFNSFPGQGWTFKIRVCDSSPNCLMSDSSDNFFSIAPQVLVSYPNGGEKLKEGDVITIKWNKDNVPSPYVTISLLDSSTRYGDVILSNTPNDGSETWKVKPISVLNDKSNNSITPLGTYVLHIGCSDNNCIVDDSDSYFTITSSIPTIPAPTATFTIEGQESYTYVPGQTNHYKWSSTNADRFSSSYTSTGPSVCGGGAWIANTAAGESNTYLDTRYVGCTWNVTYTATNSKTGKSASDTVVVKVIQSPDSASDIRATFVSSSVDVASGPSANDDVGTFQIKYNVEAVNGDVYIASTTPLAVDYVVERSGVKVTSGAIATSLMNNTDSSLTATGNYRIDEGVRNTFTFFVSVPLGGALTSGMYRMSITGLKWNTVDDVSPDKVYTDLPGFSTSYNGLNYSGGDSFAGTIQTPSMITSAIWDAVKEYMNAR